MNRNTVQMTGCLLAVMLMTASSLALSDKPEEGTLRGGVTQPDGGKPASPGADATAHFTFAYDASDAQRQAVNHIRSREAHARAIGAMEQCKACHSPDNSYLSVVNLIHRASDAAEGPWIGVAVGPADDVLRAQLKLPEGTALVVTEVMENGPAKDAGVEPHDILLSVNGQPVAAGEALTEIVKNHKPGDPPLTLALLRGGQRVEKQVTPRERPGTVHEYVLLAGTADGFRIGVDVAEPDATLRKQLRLEDVGLVVTGVAPDAPAAKQGLKVNDVLVAAGGRPVRKQDELDEAIRQAGEANRPVEIELLRGGVTLKIPVTPEKRPETALNFANHYLIDVPQKLAVVQPGVVYGTVSEGQPAEAPADPARRLEELTAQLEELRASIEAMRAEVGKGQKKE